MRRICSDLYYKFVNKSPKRLNTLYESMHHQCCKKNCGVWNYLHVNIIFLEIVFWYEVPIDKHEKCSGGVCTNTFFNEIKSSIKIGREYLIN